VWCHDWLTDQPQTAALLWLVINQLCLQLKIDILVCHIQVPATGSHNFCHYRTGQYGIQKNINIYPWVNPLPHRPNQVLIDCWSGILCRADNVDKYWFRNYQAGELCSRSWVSLRRWTQYEAANKHHCQNLFLASTAATANPSTSWTGSHCKSCSGTSHVKNRLL